MYKKDRNMCRVDSNTMFMYVASNKDTPKNVVAVYSTSTLMDSHRTTKTVSVAVYLPQDKLSSASRSSDTWPPQISAEEKKNQ